MSADTPQRERRHFSRIPMDCAALVSCGPSQWPSSLIDISLKGALIACPPGFAGETTAPCTLQLALAGKEVTITMEGHIVRHCGGRLGFRCEHIDIDSIGHLRRLVALNLGDEALLERELHELITAGAG